MEVNIIGKNTGNKNHIIYLQLVLYTIYCCLLTITVSDKWLVLVHLFTVLCWDQREIHSTPAALKCATRCTIKECINSGMDYWNGGMDFFNNNNNNYYYYYGGMEFFKVQYQFLHPN